MYTCKKSSNKLISESFVFLSIFGSFRESFGINCFKYRVKNQNFTDVFFPLLFSYCIHEHTAIQVHTHHNSHLDHYGP